MAWRVTWHQWKNETFFVDLWHVWTNEVLWWCYNLNSPGNYLQWGTASHNWIETDLSVLTMTFGTPKKLLVRGFMLSLVPCDSPCHGELNLCWFSSWLSYKSGRRVYSFFYSAGPILPTELLCILLCRFWWVVVNLWVRDLDFCC